MGGAGAQIAGLGLLAMILSPQGAPIPDHTLEPEPRPTVPEVRGHLLVCVPAASLLISVCHGLLLRFFFWAPSSWLSARTSPSILLPPEERGPTALQPGTW